MLLSPVTGLLFLVLLLNQRWFPPTSGFKLHTAVLSVLCVMFEVQLSLLVDLLNVFLVWLPNFSLKLLLLFWWLQLLLIYFYILGSTFVASLYINSFITTSFPLPFAWHFCLRVLPRLSVCMVSLFFFLIFIWPICFIIIIITRVGTLIVATIYLQLIQNRYMFRSFTVLHCSHQHCLQPVASDVEVVG